ncbi:MAG: hypothetical protein OXC93_02395 [Rhodospirillaceae bacterium]|nr:hypothetical protein [Rhodospirillaceae bacterium]
MIAACRQTPHKLLQRGSGDGNGSTAFCGSICLTLAFRRHVTYQKKCLIGGADSNAADCEASNYSNHRQKWSYTASKGRIGCSQ